MRDSESRLVQLDSQPGLSDSEWLLVRLGKAVQRTRTRHPLLDDIEVAFKAVQDVMKVARGSFACVVTLGNGLMMGFRDPWGIKPLVYGIRPHSNGSLDIMFSSESVCLEMLDFTHIQDVLPGMISFVQIFIPEIKTINSVT